MSGTERTQLPDDVIEFIRIQVGQVYFHDVDPAQWLLDKYAPEPRWHTGDVVVTQSCTSVRREGVRCTCPASSIFTGEPGRTCLLHGAAPEPAPKATTPVSDASRSGGSFQRMTDPYRAATPEQDKQR